VQFWAEDRAYGGFFPRPATLIPACDHSPELEEDAGKLCSMCVRHLLPASIAPRASHDQREEAATRTASSSACVRIPALIMTCAFAGVRRQ
jgi:hypothetical protein